MTSFFKSSYFPSTVIEWKKIEKKIEKSKNLKIQKKKKNLYSHLKTQFITAITLMELGF